MANKSAKDNARERLRQQQAAAAARKRRRRIIGVGAAVIVVIAAVVTTVVLVQHNQPEIQSAQRTIAPPDANSDNTGIIVNPGKADSSAPVVAIYLDYQCPMCHQLEESYGPTFEELADSGAIQLQYRTMTFVEDLSGVHARNIETGNPDSSQRAAVGAACADMAGVYSAYHDQIFDNQPETEGDGYSNQLLRDTIPATIGLTGTKLTDFQQCFDTQATQGFVQGVNDKGLAAGVNGTPTIKVNEKDLDLTQLSGDPADLPAAIAQAAES